MSIAKLIAEAKRSGRSHLTEVESAQLLREAGLDVVETVLATSAAEAADIGARLGFPVALKVVFSQPIPKLASGGVWLNLPTAAAVRSAYHQILSNVRQNGHSAVVEGVSVQPMMRRGAEVMIRMQRDGPFGPTISFGLGRIAVEALEDVAYRVVPLSVVDARRMIREAKGYRLLEGYRDWEPANIPLLEEALLKLSDLVVQAPEISEIELSPVYAYSDRVVALDARVALGTGGGDGSSGMASQAKRSMHRLERVFNPRSVAVVGAKRVNNYSWLHNVINFPGPKYHVNIDETEWPGAAELGFPNYRSLLDIPGEVDFVIIAVPAAVVPRVLADCVAKGVQGVHVFTAGFSETGTEEGRRLEGAIVEVARRGDLRVVGPNCLGIFNPKLNIGFSGAGYPGESGNFAFISQSGSQSNGVIAEAHAYGFKMSKLVSMGNGIVVDSAEYLDYFGQDKDSEVIGMFLEGVRQGRRFFSVLREVCQHKPVLVWKVGETEDAARATSAHSATQRILQPLWDAVLRQCGAVRVENVQEMIDVAKALLCGKPLKGPRLGLICQGGGHSTEMANVFSKAGFRVPALAARSYERLLAKFDIVGGSYRNPLEGGSLRTEEGMLEVLEILDEDENLDAIVQEFPLSRLLRSGDDDTFLKRRLDTLCKFGARARKPYAVVVDPTYPLVDPALTRMAYERLRQASIPAIYSFERTAKALWNAVEYYQRRAEREAESGKDS